MPVFLNIVLLLCLISIIYQDFTSRSIYWWLPLILAVVSLAISMQWASPWDMIIDTLLNLGFVALLLAVMALYIGFKYKTLKAFTENRFGLGDILVLLALCPLFPAFTFIIFLCSSNVLILLIELLLQITVRQNVRTIPYAGYLALFLAILTVYGFFVPDINFRSDITRYFLFSGV